MKKKNNMKLIGIVLFVVTVISVVITFVIVSNLSHPAETKSETENGFDDSFSGVLSNAYIMINQRNEIIALYEGKYYIAKAISEYGYTGVADLEISNGELVQIYAKSGNISGILSSYTEKTVQIDGYELLDCEGELPVYILSEESASRPQVSQGRISDLVIGNSEVELIVAEGRACAIVCNSQKRVNNIRVLLKNGAENLYPNIYVKCNKDCTVDGSMVEAGEVINAKRCLKGCEIGKEIRITTKEGKFFLCNENGKKKTKGYEGSFILRKEEGGYVLINELPIEDYVRYVLPSEMPVYFSYEALKAQAVCARTFAYRQMQNSAYAQYGANLDDSTAYQVYHATEAFDVTDQAVEDTKGMVLTYEGELIDCYYYSTSAGYSENLEVWDAESPGYLVAENHTKKQDINLSKKKKFHGFITDSIESYDSDSPYYRWTATLSSKLGMDPQYGRLKGIEILDRSESGYIISLKMVFEEGERIYEKENEIRFALGKYLTEVKLADDTVRNDCNSVPSACFEVKSQKDGEIVLTGGGFGHGIGMSQYGADAMGKEGKNWQEILTYYYKGVEISNGVEY